jgi:hypothetical protein
MRRSCCSIDPSNPNGETDSSADSVDHQSHEQSGYWGDFATIANGPN